MCIEMTLKIWMIEIFDKHRFGKIGNGKCVNVYLFNAAIFYLCIECKQHGFM